MTKQKKSESPSFTSLRIIGERAHKLLLRAREYQKLRMKDQLVEPPKEELQPTVEVAMTGRSIARNTFAVLAIGIGVLLLYLLLDKIVLLLLSVFVATIIDPGVQALRRLGIPRGIGVLIHYLIALFLLVFLLISLIPIIADQIQQIALFTSSQVNAFLQNPHVAFPFLSFELNTRLTLFAKNTLEALSITHFTDAMQRLGQGLSTSAQDSLVFAAHIAGSVLNFFVNLIFILVLAFFLQMEKDPIIKWLRGFLPGDYRTYVHDKSEAIQWKLSQWVRGQLILCLSIGFMVFLALSILRVPYALTLGILAAFTEFIPVIGPLIAAVPAILIALTQQGFLWAVAIAAVYYVIQWCENNLLVPLIMRRAVGLSPIAIMFAMLAGISFPGVIHPLIGIILSIPVTTIIALFLEDVRDLRVRSTSTVKKSKKLSAASASL